MSTGVGGGFGGTNRGINPSGNTNPTDLSLRGMGSLTGKKRASFVVRGVLARQARDDGRVRSLLLSLVSAEALSPVTRPPRAGWVLTAFFGQIKTLESMTRPKHGGAGACRGQKP
jgi:hypothetical protein